MDVLLYDINKFYIFSVFWPQKVYLEGKMDKQFKFDICTLFNVSYACYKSLQQRYKPKQIVPRILTEILKNSDWRSQVLEFICNSSRFPLPSTSQTTEPPDGLNCWFLFKNIIIPCLNFSVSPTLIWTINLYLNDKLPIL